MARRGQQLSDHSRVGGRLIGADLAGTWAVLQGMGEEPASGRQVPLLGDQHVDDLPELVNRPVQIHPLPGHLDIGFVHEPPVTGGVPAGTCRVDQQRSEPLHPAVDAHVIDLHSALDQQLFNIAIRKSITEVPAHCQHDHLPREPEAGERRPRREDRMNTAAAAHALEHAERRLPSMQQSRED